MALFIPVQGVQLGQIANTFGAPRSGGRSHKGIDIFASHGTPVLASRAGTVIRTSPSNQGLGGVTATIRGDDGNFYYYAHMSALGVRPGQRVNAGQGIGRVGNTGNARGTSSHLHFSVGRSGVESGDINAFDALRRGGARAGSGSAPAGDFGGQEAQGHQDRVMRVIRMMQEQMQNRGQAKLPEFAPVPREAFDPGSFSQQLGQVGARTGGLAPQVSRRAAPARGQRRSAQQRMDELIRFRPGLEEEAPGLEEDEELLRGLRG